MRKTIITKLFLLLGAILLINVMTGCSNTTVVTEVNAEYIRINKCDNEGEYKIIRSKDVLLELVLDGVANNYNEQYFENNTLIAFTLIESSSGTKNEIKSYEIKNNTITINIDTVDYGDTYDMAYWRVLVEIKNNDIINIEDVKIMKNKSDITIR